MVMKAAADGRFFKMRESWFETHNAVCEGIGITFFHSFPKRADHQNGVYFCLILQYKDPVCSEFTAKQCICCLVVVFAFTYSVSAFITLGSHG